MGGWMGRWVGEREGWGERWRERERVCGREREKDERQRQVVSRVSVV
jgi:hypothetical protein